MDNADKRGGGRFRAVVYTALVLIVAAGAGWVWLNSQHEKELDQVRNDAEVRLTDAGQRSSAIITDLASDITLAIASTIGDHMTARDQDAVASEIGAVVRGNRVLGIVVLDADGSVFAATDQRYYVSGPDDPVNRRALAATGVVALPSPAEPGRVEMAAPVTHDGNHVGAVRVFVDVSGAADR